MLDVESQISVKDKCEVHIFHFPILISSTVEVKWKVMKETKGERIGNSKKAEKVNKEDNTKGNKKT